MNITKIYDSLSQVQKTSLFMRKYKDENTIVYMMDLGFYIDDAYFLLPFIKRQFKLDATILKKLIHRYFDEMVKLLPTCPDYVTDNVYILLSACVEYENDELIEMIKMYNLYTIFEFDNKLNVLSEFGYKLIKH